MGEAAVDDWNSQAVTMNSGEKNDYPEIVPFPDLVINDINQEEDDIIVNFEALSENDDLIQFVSTGVFKSQREFNIKRKDEEKDEENVVVLRNDM